MAETGCDAVMIGRRAIGYPRIFTETACHFAGRPLPAEDFRQRLEVMRRFVTASVSCFGEAYAARMLRTRLAWFAKGMRKSSGLREAAGRIGSITDAFELIDAYGAAAEAKEPRGAPLPVISGEPCRPDLRARAD